MYSKTLQWSFHILKNFLYFYYDYHLSLYSGCRTPSEQGICVIVFCSFDT